MRKTDLSTSKSAKQSTASHKWESSLTSCSANNYAHTDTEVAHTPGLLWKHTTRPAQFTLTVDDFGVKYVGKDNAQHLIDALRQHYEVEEDWTGKLYCGISLKWDYERRHVDISMPGYVDKLLARFEHKPPSKPQHSPYAAQPRPFGRDAQKTVEHNNLPVLPPDRIKRIQQIIGTIMYYARAVDLTTLVALSSIASEQTSATADTEKRVQQLLDYLYTHKDDTLRYIASDMIQTYIPTLHIFPSPRHAADSAAHSLWEWHQRMEYQYS